MLRRILLPIFQSLQVAIKAKPPISNQPVNFITNSTTYLYKHPRLEAFNPKIESQGRLFSTQSSEQSKEDTIAQRKLFLIGVLSGFTTTGFSIFAATKLSSHEKTDHHDTGHGMYFHHTKLN